MFSARNFTPRIFASAIRSVALPPPPPTPTTLMLTCPVVPSGFTMRLDIDDLRLLKNMNAKPRASLNACEIKRSSKATLSKKLVRPPLG